MELSQRLSRLNLDITKCYEKVQNINGIMENTYVGKFVRAYRMGSGDGMTAHWEFNDEGKIITINDELWGSISGKEILGFSEVSRV